MTTESATYALDSAEKPTILNSSIISVRKGRIV